MTYRLLTYRNAQGSVRAGLLVGEHVHDVAQATGRPLYAGMLGILDDWPRAHAALTEAAAHASGGGIALRDVRLLAPIDNPGAVYCAGANYSDHLDEMSRVLGLPRTEDPRANGAQPWHFVKVGRGTIVAPHAVVTLPAYSRMVDWEIELAAVIGTPARNVAVDRALEHVAGYTIANDLSARDFVKRDNVDAASPFKWDWVSQKCFDGACPLGPWITPAAEIGDPQNLAMKLWVGDELMQDSHSSRMVFSVAEQIAFLSTRITLHPGDLVLTGTPAGVGMARRRFLRPGESVRLWIEGIGTLEHRCAA